MFGKIITKRDIPAGAVVQYDSERNALVIFNDETGELHVVAMPFVVDGVEPDPRVRLP